MKSAAAAIVFALVALVALISLSCTSAELCQSTDSKHEWSSECFAGSGAARHVKPKYVKNIVPNKAGFATLIIGNPRELVAVDGSGAIKIPNIFYTGDFDFSDAKQGLGRFQIAEVNLAGKAASKCGYFDVRNFKIVIPAIYDQCLAFTDSSATVCTNCEKYCTEPECQNSILVGGQGFTISNTNRVIHRFDQRPLDQACGGQPGKIMRITELSSYLQCGVTPDNLFKIKP